MRTPLVSVVTPFHNTGRYLAQCIDSVLGQTYANFEYVLVDNCSSDQGTAIAQDYARRDARIRFIRRPELLSQVQNYNGALAQIAGESEYCKIVQADDFIFPTCLELMVGAFGQTDTIGLVSSYYLKGDRVRGSGIPVATTRLSGREVGRLYMTAGLFVFGSPTAVMYRSSLVRGETPFYDESLLHEDTEKCFEILEYWDLGFVPQVLSALRTDDDSITGRLRGYQPDALDRFITVQRFARRFLEPDEAARVLMESRKDYYRVLAREVLRFRSRSFWEYHKNGLQTLDQRLDRSRLVWEVFGTLLRMAADPGATIRRALRSRSGSLSSTP